MRNVLFLALIGFSFLLSTGCGVIKQVATNTCTDGSYNKFVCPGILEEALDAPSKSTPKAAPKAICHSASAFMIKSRHTTRVLSRFHGQCGEVRKLLNRKVRQIGPGVKCRWMKGQIKCAGLDNAIAFIFALLCLTGRLFPKTRRACGVIGFLIGIAICCNTAEACKNPKILTLMKKTKEGTTISGEKVVIQNPRTIKLYVRACKLSNTSSLKELESQKLALLKAHAVIVDGDTMVNYCRTLSGIDNIDKCFQDEQAAASALNVLVGKAQNLYTDRWEQIEIEKRAEVKAAQEKEAQKLLLEGDKMIKEAQDALDALTETVKGL